MTPVIQWQKSSFSDGEDAPNCVEIGAWQKSSFSGDQEGPNCLELAGSQDTLLLRESDEPDAVITATGAGLAALIRHLRP
jgi:uncharacterized protein DUF397